MGRTVIVCFLGGTAGDLVTEILDPRELTLERQRLKKQHLFVNDDEKDLFLSTTIYNSVPSHDYDYHVRKNHQVLGVVCRDTNNAMWAANRFKRLHRPHVWQEMTAFCGSDTVEAYAQTMLDFGNMLANYTDNLLYLDEIVDGHAVNRLQDLGYQTPGENKYTEWLLNETSNYSNPR